MHDLAIIIVSTNEAQWLRPCLRTLFDSVGDISVDVVVVDNASKDGTRELVESEFPQARVVFSENHGFSHANNRGLMTCDARYVLFLNPDTEVREGTFADLVNAMDERPAVGLIGVKQELPSGELFPTIRRFPSPVRAMGEALASEKLSFRAPWLGERELDLSVYETEVECDWTSGSFMLARREALESAGYLDERFFIYAEECDLCLRIKRTGWEIRHLPHMTILHHAVKAGISPRVEAQNAFAKRQYARKNFPPFRRAAYLAALSLHHAIRATVPLGEPETARQRQEANRRALKTLVGLEDPPYELPPERAVAHR